MTNIPKQNISQITSDVNKDWTCMQGQGQGLDAQGQGQGLKFGP